MPCPGAVCLVSDARAVCGGGEDEAMRADIRSNGNFYRKYFHFSLITLPSQRQIKSIADKPRSCSEKGGGWGRSFLVGAADDHKI
jgi:hypothetical protein